MAPQKKADGLLGKEGGLTELLMDCFLDKALNIEKDANIAPNEKSYHKNRKGVGFSKLI